MKTGMKRFFFLFCYGVLASVLTSVVVGCSSLKTCTENDPSFNYSSQSGPVCQLQPGHEPRSLEGFSGMTH